jgi:hypothetical protein
MPAATFRPFRLAASWQLAIALAMLAPPTLAAPAPWYYWRSKVDGVRLCAQTSPGHGWERDSAVEWQRISPVRSRGQGPCLLEAHRSANVICWRS